jgi:hypothetical protein
MHKVKCHKCGQVRKAISSKAHFVLLEHSMSKITMRRNEQNKWECAKNYGCERNNTAVKG